MKPRLSSRADMSLKFGPKRWPQLPPALHVFPTLQRFTPAFAPRRAQSVPPGNPHRTHLKARIGSVQYIYDDLGVLTYAGASASQTAQIGKLLSKLNSKDSTLPDLRSCRVGAIKNAKYAKYKLTTEDRHIEQGPKEKEGFLTSVAVSELGTQAATRWMNKTIAAAQKRYPSFKVGYFRESYVHIVRGLFTKGIINNTVNGPKRLNVDAHVVASPMHEGISITVELYAVGTNHYVGKMTVGCALFTEDHKVMNNSETETVLRSAQSLDLTPPSTIQSVTDVLWKLERQIWSDRVDENEYPRITPAEAAARKEKGLTESETLE